MNPLTELNQLPDAPTPLDLKAFDRDCSAYTAMRAAAKDLNDKADKLKAQILANVERHGFVPSNAEKSRRVEAREFIATVTIGTGLDVDDSKAFDLELLLSRARCSKLFSALFTRRVEYSLAKTAKETMQTAPWPKKYREQIQQLYTACFTPKTIAPKLEVESRAAAEEKATKAAAKKPRGKKAA